MITKEPSAVAPKSGPRKWARIRKIGLRVLAAGATLYVGMTLFALAIESDVVFDASRPDQEWIDKPDPSIQDVTLHSADGAMHAWYCAPERPDAAILVCHGNAGNLSFRGHNMVELRKRFNAAIMVFDYPGYGLSEGEPSERGCYAAADAAFDWLVQEKGFQPQQIIVYGESLGGGVAVDIASRRPVSALVLVNTFANLPEVAQRIYFWLPAVALMRNRFDSEKKIHSVQAPIFITHGTGDRLIPFEHSLRLLAQARSPKEFLAREGKGHRDPLSDEELDCIHAFLITHSQLPGETPPMGFASATP
jgi:pimeloyl-ACP methyl ester carboxylesterase